MMKEATSTGRLMKATWDASMVSTVPPIRLAMNRSVSGLMAWSWAEIRYEVGLVFQPAEVHFSLSVAAATGRCVAAITAARSAGRAGQKVSRNGARGLEGS